MPRALLAGTLAIVLATAPAMAQERQQRPAARAATVLIGLPVFSSDGQQIGKVTELGKYDGQPVLIVEIDRPLGIGPDAVAIPIDMFVQRPDRIELTITADQVRDRLARPDRSSER
jgi:PRC-barrel domain